MDIWDRLREVRAHYTADIRSAPTPLLARADRRQHPRVSVNHLPAMLYIGDADHHVAIENISMSGACIVGAPSGPLAEGDAVILATTLGSYGPFVVACDVVREESMGHSSRLGVRFMALDEDGTNALFFFLHDLWSRRTSEDGYGEAIAVDRW